MHHCQNLSMLATRPSLKPITWHIGKFQFSKDKPTVHYEPTLFIPAPPAPAILRGSSFNSGVKLAVGDKVSVGGEDHGHGGLPFDATSAVPTSRQRQRRRRQRRRCFEGSDPNASRGHSGHLLGASGQRTGFLHLQEVSGEAIMVATSVAGAWVPKIMCNFC